MTKKSKILKWFDGKKTAIAAIYWTFVTPSLPIIYGSMAEVPSDIMKIYLIVGVGLSAIGLGHKGIKAVTPTK